MRISFREWVLEADAEATRAAYARAKTGGSESCGCDPCRNFVASRRIVYPDEVRRLFGQLGIDADKEGEAYWTHRSADGLHHFGGWFHFVGSVVSGPAGLVEITTTFSLGFESDANAPRLEPLRGAQAVQVEFDVAIPWNCDRPETME